LVQAVRAGQSVRSAAAQWGFAPATAAYWIERARGQRLDRVNFANRKPGRAWNRCSVELEQRILSLRHTLREHSVLGEYGLDAIAAALHDEADSTPSRTTIYRVLERHGTFDAVHRVRRPAPPRAGTCRTWHVAAPNSTASTSSRI
jgi:transposase